MSWFDGVIPGVCRQCFLFSEGKWQMKPDAACDDSCDVYLEMFPVIDSAGILDHEKILQR